MLAWFRGDDSLLSCLLSKHFLGKRPRIELRQGAGRIAMLFE